MCESGRAPPAESTRSASSANADDMLGSTSRTAPRNPEITEAGAMDRVATSAIPKVPHRALDVWEKHFWNRRLRKATVTDVSDDADDGRVLFETVHIAHPHTPSDGFVSAPPPLYDGLVDDGDVGSPWRSRASNSRPALRGICSAWK